MNIREFIDANNGRHVEVSGSSNAKYQCVDLANAYLRDVRCLPIIEHTNAKDFPSKAGNQYDWVPYRPGLKPIEGDVIVWDETVGSVGHISLMPNNNADDVQFTSFDQNWPVGSPCHFQVHNYKGVAGWLRPINTLTNEPMTQEERKEFDKIKTYVLNYHEKNLSFLNELTGELSLAIEGLRGADEVTKQKMKNMRKRIEMKVGELPKINQ